MVNRPPNEMDLDFHIDSFNWNLLTIRFHRFFKDMVAPTKTPKYLNRKDFSLYF